MQVDVITFESGTQLYRPPGAHDFAPGFDYVVSVNQVRVGSAHGMDAAAGPMVKNLCGRFTTYLEAYLSHAPVCKKPKGSTFGAKRIMHHLHGTVSVHCGLAYFKGCCGCDGLAALADDLFLGSTACQIHMGVFKVSLGRHLQTTPGCFFERSVTSRFKSVRARHRLDDQYQAVKLQVAKFSPEEMPILEGKLAPTLLDISVTNTGVALLRFSWARCSWTPEAESTVLRFCSWLADQMRLCC